MAKHRSKKLKPANAPTVKHVSKKRSTGAYTQRTVSLKVVGNIGKLVALEDLADEINRAGMAALHQYQTAILTGFNYADASTKHHIDNAVLDHLKTRFPRLYSKTLQKITKSVVASTLAESPKKLLRTKNLTTTPTFDNQMFDLDWKLGRKHLKCWLRIPGLQFVDRKTGRLTGRYRQLKIALVGDMPLEVLRNSVSIDEVRLVRKRRKLKTNNKDNKKSTDETLASGERLTRFRVQVVISERVVATPKLEATQRLRLDERRVVGVDQNRRSIDCSDGADSWTFSLDEYAERSIKHRANAKKFRRFGRDCIEKLSTKFVQQCVDRGITVVVFEDLAGIQQAATRETCTKGTAFRHMLNSGFPNGQLQTRTIDKLRRRGILSFVVDPAYTSQTCSRCNWRDQKNRKSTEGFRCRCCGRTVHSGINASEMIRQRWLVDRLRLQRSKSSRSSTFVSRRHPNGRQAVVYGCFQPATGCGLSEDPTVYGG